MVELLADIAVLLALILSIPCLIVMFFIIKHFSTKVLKQHIAFKFFLLTSFIHSLLFVAYLFQEEFMVALTILSSFMFPTYIMLIFRQINFSIQANIRQKVLKEVTIKTTTKKRVAARLKRERQRLIAKSKWK